MPKIRKAELSFLYVTRRLILFYISTKYHWNIPKGIWVTEWTQNLFQIKQRVITPNVRKPEIMSILYVTRHLVLTYISTKYHQNILKGIQVTEQTRSFTPTLSLWWGVVVKVGVGGEFKCRQHQEKRRALEHAQKMHRFRSSCTCTVSSWPMLFIDSFCNIQRFC